MAWSLAVFADDAQKVSPEGREIEIACGKLGADHHFEISQADGGTEKSYVCRKDGRNDGPYLGLHPNGKLRARGFFSLGELQGHWVRWHSNGNLHDEGDWIAGAPEGAWSVWNENGSLVEQGRFEKGQKVCEWTYRDKATGVESKHLEKETPDCPQGSAATSATSIAISLSRFRTGAIYVFQASGGLTYSGVLTWNPELKLSRAFAVGITAGGSVLKQTSNSFFPLLEYSLNASFTNLPFLPQLGWELGFGAQTWVNYGGTNWEINTSFLWKFDHRLLGFVDRLFVGYVALPSSSLTQELKLGLGFGW